MEGHGIVPMSLGGKLRVCIRWSLAIDNTIGLDPNPFAAKQLRVSRSQPAQPRMGGSMTYPGDAIEEGSCLLTKVSTGG